MFNEFVYTLAPPPCSAGIIMTSTITTTSAAILLTLFKLLISIKIECTVNVHWHFEINKELFKKAEGFWHKAFGFCSLYPPPLTLSLSLYYR